MKHTRTLLFLFCMSLFLSSCLVIQQRPGNNGKHKGWENGNGNNGKGKKK